MDAGVSHFFSEFTTSGMIKDAETQLDSLTMRRPARGAEPVLMPTLSPDRNKFTYAEPSVTPAFWSLRIINTTLICCCGAIHPEQKGLPCWKSTVSGRVDGGACPAAGLLSDTSVPLCGSEGAVRTGYPAVYLNRLAWAA